MTSNQIKAKANKIAEDQNRISRAKLKEDTRANKARERLGIAQAALSVPTALASGFGKGAAQAFGKSLNHIEWYNKNQVSLENAASISNSFLRGTQLVKDYVGDPGFICHHFVDTLPVTKNSMGLDSPINLAARSLFSINRKFNSGSVNYEAADYMMYIMGIASYIELYAYLIKVYSIATNSSKDSLYKQTVLLESYGYEANSILNNLSGLRQLINLICDVLKSYAIPADIPYIARKIWLVSNTFKDKNSDRSQLHHFIPLVWYHYSDGILSPVNTSGLNSGDLMSFTDLQTSITSRLNEILANETFAIMSGDTRKAFTNLYDIQNIPVEVGFNPVYDEDINNQIRCANIAPKPLTLTINQVEDPDAADYGRIYQGSGPDGLDFTFTRFNLLTKDEEETSTNKLLLNFNKDSATYEDVVRATRFSTIYKIDQGKVAYVSCGTEIIVESRIYSYYGDEVKVFNFNVDTQGGTNYLDFSEFATSYNATLNKLYVILKLSCIFDNAPRLPVKMYGFTAERPMVYLAELSDNNYNQVILSSDTLDRINTVAFMSLIGVFSYIR